MGKGRLITDAEWQLVRDVLERAVMRAESGKAPGDESECNVGCQCLLLPVEEGQQKADPLKIAAEEHRSILDESRNKYEIDTVIDSNGKIVLRKSGDQSAVRFTQDESELIKNAEIMLHNHPSSSSFSPEDVFFTVSHNIKEMRVIAPDSLYGSGHFYIRPKVPGEYSSNGEFLKDLHKRYQLEYNRVFAEFRPLVESGEMPIDLVHRGDGVAIEMLKHTMFKKKAYLGSVFK